MIIDSVTYYITEAQVDTNLSFKFEITPNGKYSAKNRGISSDVYRTKISMYDSKSTLETLTDYFETLRALGSTVVPIEFETGEEVFGADIDYTGAISCILLNESPIYQRELNSYSLEFELELYSPAFTGTPVMPDLQYTEPNWTATAEKTKDVVLSYDGAIFINNMDSDHGIFRGKFYFTDDEMANLRRYHSSLRGEPFYIYDISGLEYLFGKKRDVIFPVRVRMVEVSERLENPGRWGCNITLVEEV